MGFTFLFFFALLSILHAGVRVDVWPTTSFAPAWVHIKAHIDRSDDNRSMAVWIDGDNFSRLSSQELEGAAAPITYWFEYKGIPPGEYEVGVQVANAMGKVTGRAARRIVVEGEQ
jgi:hypothetical protein